MCNTSLPERDYTRYLKWSSIKKGTCQIDNGTLKSFIWSKMWKITSFLPENCLIIHNVPAVEIS